MGDNDRYMYKAHLYSYFLNNSALLLTSIMITNDSTTLKLSNSNFVYKSFKIVIETT